MRGPPGPQGMTGLPGTAVSIVKILFFELIRCRVILHFKSNVTCICFASVLYTTI